PLRVPGGLALDPVLLPGAAPVGGAARREGAVQRLVVHPPEHQHLPAVVLLHDRGHQPVGGAAEPVGDGGVEGHSPTIQRGRRVGVPAAAPDPSWATHEACSPAYTPSGSASSRWWGPRCTTRPSSTTITSSARSAVESR